MDTEHRENGLSTPAERAMRTIQEQEAIITQGVEYGCRLNATHLADNKMTLTQRMQRVADEVRTIDKDMSVGAGQYSYKAVSDLNVTKKVKEAELRWGVSSMPTKQELVHHEVIHTDRRIQFSVYVKMTVVFKNVDNEDDQLTVESFGHGLDSGDKAFGKASTYARKYALLNAYKIATGEDPDQYPSQELNVKKQAQKQPKKPLFPSEQQDPEKFRQVVSYLKHGSVDSQSGEVRTFTLKDVERKYTLTNEVRNALVDASLFEE